MNERIQELHKQAVAYALSVCDAAGVYQGREYLQVIREKFAQLIVQECVQTLGKRYMGDNNREDMEVRRCIEDVKQHFGVK